MSIAILGASSQIAKDLIFSFAKAGRRDLLLYVRSTDRTSAWVVEHGLQHACSVHHHDTYGLMPHDVVINFVGVGDPMRTAEMGSAILPITAHFDGLVMAGLEQHPHRRYLFLSSGAVYGNSFTEPATADTQATIAINAIRPQDGYAMAKLYAEVGHRGRPDLAIVDLRVFNIFSRTHDINARFFITDIVRAIRDKRSLQTSTDYMVRDFMHPQDFHQLVECLLAAPRANCAIDCYSREPIDKPLLLQTMAEHFGLHYEVVAGTTASVNATGAKPFYYSLNRKAAEFGYQPQWSSLEVILTETAAILDGESAAA